MKYLYIILIVTVACLLSAAGILGYFKINQLKPMTEIYYETSDPFFNQKQSGKTYGQIANAIIGELAGLKKDFPELTGIYDNPDYNLTKSLDAFRVVFQYNDTKAGGILWSVELEKYERPTLPEGKTPLPPEMMPDYDFIGKIGDMLVLVSFKEENDQVKNRIIEILKQNGAVEQDKSILIPI